MFYTAPNFDATAAMFSGFGLKLNKVSLLAAAAAITSLFLLGVVIGLAVKLSTCLEPHRKDAEAGSTLPDSPASFVTTRMPTAVADEMGPRVRPESNYRQYRHTAVTSDSPICSSIGA